jgi:hypothetical protein
VTTIDNKAEPIEDAIFDQVLELLRSLLPARWGVSYSVGGSNPNDKYLVMNPGSGSYSAIVEVRRSITPVEARQLFAGTLAPRVRAITGNNPIVVIAPYISPRTREVLVEQDISYVDLAGNVRLDLQNTFIEIDRVNRNPNAAPEAPPGLRGATAGRIARVLIDAIPPFGVAEVALAAASDRGYVSRVLDSLAEQALVERERRGKITGVDWPALIRARASSVELLSMRGAQGFISPGGVQELVRDRLRESKPRGLFAVTGSFVATFVAPIAPPALLVCYTTEPVELANRLGLLSTAQGANVYLIDPPNDGPFDRSTELDELPVAAFSQVAIDCLSGNGRMPAEGEALVEWMADNQSTWRRPISELPPPAQRP